MTPNKPNFLIFLSDQHRGDWLPYDKSVSKSKAMKDLPLIMPNVKSIMKKGVTFTNAITPSPLCAPARACLTSGKRYKDCGVKGNYQNYPITKHTYYKKLKNEGYITASVGKLDLHKATLFWGLNGWLEEFKQLGFTNVIDNEGKWDAIFSVIREKDTNGKFRRVKSSDYTPKGPYMNFLKENNLLDIHVNDFMKRFGKKNLNTDPTPLPEFAYCDNWVAKNAITMLKGFSHNQPWHLVVNFVGPHDPWDVTKRMKKKVKNKTLPPPFQVNGVTYQAEIEVRKNYAAMIENIDRNIGLILNEVRRRNELDNTVIIYTSDHGEMLGDFGRYGKLRPERGSISIPLIITAPNCIKNYYSGALVELQDLNNTILNYAGLKFSNSLDSNSLRSVIEGKSDYLRDYQVSAIDLSEVGLSGWKMISDGQYKLVVEDQRNIKLFNIKKDPWEEINLSNEKKSIRNKLYQELERIYD
ncbi:MAG: sulfatase-like hydrolase/transferase [Candidatus Lokiarchaeota archaeon]|nr:sulfatase-like hydrolase/transferase [Candidatus Lokiarchaeota archaeon]MBD3199870.1 sulfatase-like hydrolase/transferase [Candidatus Lokiarchaeota archaeon]